MTIKAPHQVELPAEQLVKERIADATQIFAGISHVSGIAQNTASASDNLQSVPNAIDTLSAILRPLKLFNSAATWIADVTNCYFDLLKRLTRIHSPIPMQK
jgi:hypothetical protein